MTARICTVRHCGRPAASAYSPHCSHHKSIVRRHGAPDQRGITKAELEPYLRRVEARVAKNPESDLWGILEASWLSIVSDARVSAAQRVGNRYERSAANEIAAVAQSAESASVIRTILAVVLLWNDFPQRFASDNALRVQLARRVRAISQSHVGLRYDHRTGRQIRIYREMTPKAAAIFGQKLMIAFGGVGLKLAALDERDRKAASDTKQQLAAALSQLN